MAANSSVGNQTEGSTTSDANSRRERRVAHLNRWLWDVRSKDPNSLDWYGIAELKLAQNSRIKELLLASELGFELAPLESEQGDGIRIQRVHNKPAGWVEFRVKNDELQIRRSSELTDEFENPSSLLFSTSIRPRSPSGSSSRQTCPPWNYPT